jgi:hypothetical protein
MQSVGLSQMILKRHEIPAPELSGRFQTDVGIELSNDALERLYGLARAIGNVRFPGFAQVGKRRCRRRRRRRMSRFADLERWRRRGF